MKRISFILLLLAAVILPVRNMAQTAETGALVGHWRGAVTGEGETNTFELFISNAAGGALSGEMSSSSTKVTIKDLIVGKDNSISFETLGKMKFTGKVTLLTGTMFSGEGDSMEGEVMFNSAKASWKAHKIASGGEKLATAKEYFARGDAHYTKKDYRKAIGDFTEALKLSPQSSQLYSSRGLLYKFEADRQKGTAGNMSASLEGFLGKPVKVTPTNALLSLNLAIADLTQAVNLNSSNSIAFNGRGLAYLEKCNLAESDTGDCRRAAADFSEALKLSPNVAALYSNRALVYKKLGMTAEAAADERKAAELTAKP